VREILVQYVGDVAIYVRSNKLDRFDAVRSEVKEAARSVVSALAYDTLNRLMQDDWLCGGALRVASRTETMVTFGSPLNKTAFLFTIQGKDSLHIRERLASTVQPLIMSCPKSSKI